MRGDIVAPRVVLADGARFKGSIDMDRKSAAASQGTRPAAPAVEVAAGAMSAKGAAGA
jgi:hypothetical protein